VTATHVVLWAITVLAIAGMLVRPRGIAEWMWALGGAVALVLTGAIGLPAAAQAVWRGADVYAFLIGILALAELARDQGVFDWIAGWALEVAAGSQQRLLLLVYGVGIVTTAFLANDTTAVLLTSAVLAAFGTSGKQALPQLYACAFVSNAASFLLPFSNPANLVVYGRALPALAPWLVTFIVPSLVAVALTYGAIVFCFRRSLQVPLAAPHAAQPPDPRTRRAAWAIGVASVALAVAAGLGWDLGVSALVLATLAVALLAAFDRAVPLAVARGVQWQVVPLVAGLFVIVAALDAAGALRAATELWGNAARWPWPAGVLGLGGALTVASNLANNLPVALATGYAIAAAHPQPALSHAALIAVDLGPNFSVTGSLATLLWLMVLRRAEIHVTSWDFFRIGAVVALPALIAALLVVR
jgi:arsenical pump membrane protein